MINNSKIALALILGSGVDLDDDLISGKTVILEDKKGIHHKTIYTCSVQNKGVLVFKGRRHFYEGYSLEEITFNINFAINMGVERILITNAAGGLNENFSEGDLMLITSHINFLDKLRFTSKKAQLPFYSKELQDKFRSSCRIMNVKLHEGTYGCYSGPTYETKAEIRFQKKIMLDAAGMSTVPEVIESSSKRIEVIALSVITNLLKENSAAETSHDNVLLTAQKASLNLKKVLPVFISQLN
ncbi:MAG TPA: purine-nucleoside phosphorylase [Ignavibacteria bacterium]|nr:purine-nucleoside phosphorylase [Ignavibacteria bacterium]HMQ98823.1 purine-nucleoside phosphorylase [Ignavibacteria bacterium]